MRQGDLPQMVGHMLCRAERDIPTDLGWDVAQSTSPVFRCRITSNRIAKATLFVKAAFERVKAANLNDWSGGPLHGSTACDGRGRWCVSIRSTNADPWRYCRRDPFCVDSGVGRGDRPGLHCELAHLQEMDRLACSAGASLRPPAKR